MLWKDIVNLEKWMISYCLWRWSELLFVFVLLAESSWVPLCHPRVRFQHGGGSKTFRSLTWDQSVKQGSEIKYDSTFCRCVACLSPRMFLETHFSALLSRNVRPVLDTCNETIPRIWNAGCFSTLHVHARCKNWGISCSCSVWLLKSCCAAPVLLSLKCF